MADTPLNGDTAGALRVSVDVFDGPLDLLLHLVRERQLDIATVPLATVAQQFFDYIATMDALNVEVAAEYLVIAATLVFLKSKSLLPPIPTEFAAENEDTPERVEAELRQRLVAYSKYKGAADELRARRDEADAFYFRDGGDSTTDLVQRYRIVPAKLALALQAALRAAKPEKRTIARDRFSIARQMQFIVRVIRDRGAIEFVDLCRDLDRGGVIATFLAILELIRQHRLSCEQPAPDEPLRLLPFSPVEISEN